VCFSYGDWLPSASPFGIFPKWKLPKNLICSCSPLAVFLPFCNPALMSWMSLDPFFEPLKVARLKIESSFHGVPSTLLFLLPFVKYLKNAQPNPFQLQVGSVAFHFWSPHQYFLAGFWEALADEKLTLEVNSSHVIWLLLWNIYWGLFYSLLFLVDSPVFRLWRSRILVLPHPFCPLLRGQVLCCFHQKFVFFFSFCPSCSLPCLTLLSPPKDLPFPGLLRVYCFHATARFRGSPWKGLGHLGRSSFRGVQCLLCLLLFNFPRYQPIDCCHLCSHCKEIQGLPFSSPWNSSARQLGSSMIFYS